MSLYLRKSVSVGPFRFNLSQSGIGVSVGVRGLRFGVSPRGNYIHVGGSGVYYRKTWSAGTDRARDRLPQSEAAPIEPQHTHDPLRAIESADVSQMLDSSSSELLAELDAKHKKVLMWPLVLVIGAAACVALWASAWGFWLGVVLVPAVVAGTLAAYRADQMRKTVILLYDLAPNAEQAYASLHEAAGKVASCERIWHIEAQGQVRERKYHAGASYLVRRHGTTCTSADPPFIRTNIRTIALGVGSQTLYLFPDRILVYNRGRVGAVSYADLRISVDTSQFIEDGPAPFDARVVGRTWRYVNKNGGPDRREWHCRPYYVLAQAFGFSRSLAWSSRRGRCMSL